MSTAGPRLKITLKKNPAAIQLRAIGPPHIDNTMDSAARLPEYEAQMNQLHRRAGREDEYRRPAVENTINSTLGGALPQAVADSSLVKATEAEVFHFQVFFNSVF